MTNMKIKTENVNSVHHRGFVVLFWNANGLNRKRLHQTSDRKLSLDAIEQSSSSTSPPKIDPRPKAKRNSRLNKTIKMLSSRNVNQ